MRIDYVIYEPNQRHKHGWLKTWAIMVQNIINSRELIVQLFKRDFFMSYKKSFFGWSWIFVSPIMGIVSWVFMNSTGILAPGTTGIPYPAYVLLSSSIWGLFMSFYSSSRDTLSAGAGFINQVKYPHEALLIKQTLQELANFAIAFVLNLVVLLCFGVFPHGMIFLFPLMVLPLFFFGAGLGLIMSVVRVVAADIEKVFSIFLGLLLYVTPVIYSATPDNPYLRKIIAFNPLAYLISGVRDSMLYGNIPHFNIFLLCAALAALFFLFTWRIFYLTEEKVIEKMI
jgi:lipopolysaccharide transport system permease protein